MKVYLVEDAVDIRNRLHALVEELGHRVVGEAATEREAVGELLAINPDVAIVDLRLAEGSGIEVVRRTKSARPGMIMIILTNSAEPTYQKACMAAGADFFFDKSFDIPRLISLLMMLAGNAA